MTAPAERVNLWLASREGALFESIQHETILEAEVERGLQGAIKIELWFGLVPQGRAREPGVGSCNARLSGSNLF